jgi:large subunit ribosomal protein L6
VSRVGRKPIPVPPQVKVEIDGSFVRIKGPKGELEHSFPSNVAIEMINNEVQVTRGAEDAFSRSLHGTTRAVIHNMITGVSSGFKRLLEINGVGYRAEVDGNKLVLYVGYSHPVVVEPPEGIDFEVDARTRQITVSGYDKQKVGQIAANIREVRPPEPYQGKGIKYLEEKIRRKAGKSGKG